MHQTVGIARPRLRHVSADDQNLTLQRDALQCGGCEKGIVDTIPGTTAARPSLDKVRKLLRAGDTLVVWRLDRLGRSLTEMFDTAHKLQTQGVKPARSPKLLTRRRPQGG